MRWGWFFLFDKSKVHDQVYDAPESISHFKKFFYSIINILKRRIKLPSTLDATQDVSFSLDHTKSYFLLLFITHLTLLILLQYHNIFLLILYLILNLKCLFSRIRCVYYHEILILISLYSSTSLIIKLNMSLCSSVYLLHLSLISFENITMVNLFV